MMRIPLVDLQAQYRAIKPEIDAAIQRVLESAQFILGPEMEAFEREMAAYCGTAHAIAVASGTDALALSLRACGIGPGDEVITTAYSFFATAEAIVTVGATPVFADIELAAYTLDPAAVACAITPRTKAILPVHLYGHPCRMEEIMAMANARGLVVIEDCAQAIGAQYRGRRVGSFGKAGCFSFFPSKNLGGYGDGGMVLTHDAALAEQVQLLRCHGSRERYRHVVLGTNSRLDELQAAILRVKLRYLDTWNEARRRHADAYAKALSRYGVEEIQRPQELPGCSHVYHLYTIRTHERERLRTALDEGGIASQVYYPSTLLSQPALASLVTGCRPCPNAEEAARTVLSLPMYPELAPETIERIVHQIARAHARPPHQ